MVTTQTIALAYDGSRTFDAYLARPEHGKAPSIMIFTEMFGIGQHNRDMAEDFARRGFNALIPNLFWRAAYPGELAFEGPDRDAAWARLAALDIDAAGRDIDTAVQWLRAQPFSNDKVFALGFCAGGRMAFAHSAGSLPTTNVVTRPNLARMPENNCTVAPNTEAEHSMWSPDFNSAMAVVRMADMPLAVATHAHTHAHVETLNDLRPHLLDEIEAFFETYNALKKKDFKPIHRSGPKKARKLVDDGVDAFTKRSGNGVPTNAA